MGKKKVIQEVSTEEKIKIAARKVFMKKGFAAARTRDIAEEAGLNLALLNYYFRSKQKLFDEIMEEKIRTLLGTIIPVLNDSSASLEEKVDRIVTNYIAVLSENSDLPLFVLNELRKDDGSFISKLPVGKTFLQNSFIQQLKQRKPDINPVHFLISLLGLTIFPFVAKPILIRTGMVSEKKFISFVQERRKLIPHWMKSILKN